MLYGISVCGNASIEKFGVLAMHLDESIRITPKILAESKVSKIVFIEVSSNAIIIPERQKNYYQGLISFSTTVNSLSTLKNSISASLFGADKICSTPTMKADEHTSIDEEIRGGFPIKLLSPDEYHSLNEIDKIKAKKRIQHHIVFFIAPLPKELLAKENYWNICNKVSQQMQQTIDALQKLQGGIKLSFLNLTETDIVSEYQFKYHSYYSGWYDSNHFKPVIGDEVIAYLLKNAL